MGEPAGAEQGERPPQLWSFAQGGGLMWGMDAVLLTSLVALPEAPGHGSGLALAP